jgi:Mlc titration factor MtfA (ptsG expression regulator)
MLSAFIVIAALMIISAVRRYQLEKQAKFHSLAAKCPPVEVDPADIVFTGMHPSLKDEDITRILSRRFPYYHSLDQENKERFVKRLKAFISEKTFIIKADEGYKEMPVLVSAAAVQLSFGLKDYLLPFYNFIRIYPEEYCSPHSFLTVLAGNVKANVITVAWNHFLKGFEDPADGSNVGLHEMSHALYFQKIKVEGDYAWRFFKQYDVLEEKCKEAHQMELKGSKDLYSDYAVTDIQEFWAESIELFFEKPRALISHYPDVYAELTELLNQDPLNHSSPVLPDTRSIGTKVVDYLFR